MENFFSFSQNSFNVLPFPFPPLPPLPHYSPLPTPYSPKIGKVNHNTAPSFTVLVTPISPPWAEMIWRQR